MPPPAEPRDEGPGLVEPEQPEPTLDLDSLDTGRILRDTGSLNIPDLSDDESSDTAEDSGAEHGVPRTKPLRARKPAQDSTFSL